MIVIVILMTVMILIIPYDSVIVESSSAASSASTTIYHIMPYDYDHHRSFIGKQHQNQKNQVLLRQSHRGTITKKNNARYHCGNNNRIKTMTLTPMTSTTFKKTNMIDTIQRGGDDGISSNSIADNNNEEGDDDQSRIIKTDQQQLIIKDDDMIIPTNNIMDAVSILKIKTNHTQIMKKYLFQCICCIPFILLVILYYNLDNKDFILSNIYKRIDNQRNIMILSSIYKNIILKISLLTGILIIQPFIKSIGSLKTIIIAAQQGNDNNNSNHLYQYMNMNNIMLFLRICLFAIVLLRRMIGMQSNFNSAYIPAIEQHYTFEYVNDKYNIDHMAYQKIISQTTTSSSKPSLTSSSWLQRRIQRRKQKLLALVSASKSLSDTSLSNSIIQKITSSKNNKNINNNGTGGTAIILDWTNLDVSVSIMDTLRDKVSFIIHLYHLYYKDQINNNIDSNMNDSSNPSIFEVIILLESPGGSASDYALAACQIIRMKQCGIIVTICVDKVAASGMYYVIFVGCIGFTLCWFCFILFACLFVF